MNVYQVWLKLNLNMCIPRHNLSFRTLILLEKKRGAIDNDRNLVCVHPCILSALHHYFFTLKKTSSHSNCMGNGSRINEGVRRIALLCLKQTQNVAAIRHWHSKIIHCFTLTPLSAFTVVPRQYIYFSLLACSVSLSIETSVEF